MENGVGEYFREKNILITGGAGSIGGEIAQKLLTYNVGLTVLGDAKKERLYDVWHGDKLNKTKGLHKNYELEKVTSCRICEFNKYPENKKRWAA